MELNKVISDFNEKHKLESIRVEFSFLKNGIKMYAITDGKISLYAMAMRGTKEMSTAELTYALEADAQGFKKNREKYIRQLEKHPNGLISPIPSIFYEIKAKR